LVAATRSAEGIGAPVPSSAGRPLVRGQNLHTMPRKGALCEIEDGIGIGRTSAGERKTMFQKALQGRPNT
jgi:hypothetical protein